jgi:hypothetical protein
MIGLAIEKPLALGVDQIDPAAVAVADQAARAPFRGFAGDFGGSDDSHGAGVENAVQCMTHWLLLVRGAPAGPGRGSSTGRRSMASGYFFFADTM